MDKSWDWRRMIPSMDWHKLVLAGYPGWQKPIDNSPAFVTFMIINGTDKSSRDMAVEWDDIGHGQFWYRDYTKSSLPFIDKGDLYQSIFCFQYEQDAIEFNHRFGGRLNKPMIPFEELTNPGT